MRKILIPTDFTVESLNVLKNALLTYPDEKLDIVILHGAKLPGSILDLMFFSKEKYLESLENASYSEAKAILLNKFNSRINSLTTDLFFGSNNNAFKNFIEANGISEAFIPKNYPFKAAHKKSFNILPFFKSSSLKITELNMAESKEIFVRNTIANLFAS